MEGPGTVLCDPALGELWSDCLLVVSGKPKLLDQLHQRLRSRHYSLRTERAHVMGMKPFICFHYVRYPAEIGTRARNWLNFWNNQQGKFMSIRRRVEDALEIHRLNRFEGALLSALVAAAATARKEQPNSNVGDRECFEAFLAKGAFQRLGGVEFRGKLHTIPHIFYKWLRCELVHEGVVPIDIEFVGDESSGVLSLRVGGAPSYVLQLSHGWLFEILHLVKTSSANEDQFTS